MKTANPLQGKPARHRSFSSLRYLSKTIWVASCLPLLLCAGHIVQAQERHPLEKSAPVYPALARKMQIQGTVRVAATIDSSGRVTGAESSSRERLLVPAAIEAVKRWKFEPGPATQVVMIDIQFTL